MFKVKFMKKSENIEKDLASSKMQKNILGNFLKIINFKKKLFLFFKNCQFFLCLLIFSFILTLKMTEL